MDIRQYPVLQPGNELHLSPKGGTLLVEGTPHTLSIEQADFIRGCDGTSSLGEIVPKTWSEPYGDFKFLLFVSRLIDDRRLVLKDEPAAFPLRITGSRTAYIPPHMSIELTVGCNLKCRHCYRESDASKNSYMPTGELLDVLQRLHAAGLRAVELTGGEPLLHAEFPRILDFCRDHFELVGVLSNGTILRPAIAERYRAMGNQLLLSVSLDGSNAEAHDLRRGVPGSFARTTRNIERLAGMGVKVRVSMCVDEESFADLENTLLMARKLGACAFSYTPVLPLGRGKDWAPPGWNLDGKEVLRAEEELAERYRGFLTVLPTEAICQLEGDEGCGAGYRTYTLDPWGRVRPCATYSPEQLVIGNLRKQSIEEVFGHPLTRAMEKLPVPQRETCAGCEYELFCRYCGLRGITGSFMAEECAWSRLPPVQEVLRHWNAANAKGPVPSRPLEANATST